MEGTTKNWGFSLNERKEGETLVFLSLIEREYVAFNLARTKENFF